MTIISQNPVLRDNNNNSQLLDAKSLKDRIDLRDLVRRFDAEYFARSHYDHDKYYSPFRDDGDTASFTVYRDHFFDYGGEKESGDHIGYLQKRLGVGFKEALEQLAQIVGGGVVPTAAGAGRVQRTATSEPPPAPLQAAIREAAQLHQAYLWSSRPDAALALDYLRIERGLSDETICRAGLGYNPSWSKLGYKDDKGQVKVAPGITIPYIQDDVVWALRVRRRVGSLAEYLGIPEDTNRDSTRADKYLNVRGSRPAQGLYGHLDERKSVVIVEGEFDCLLAQQILSKHYSVVTPGPASKVARRWTDRIKTAPTIYLAMDADTAGIEAAQRIAEHLPDGRVGWVPVPVGYDITDYVNDGGDLLELVRGALTCCPYSLDDQPASVEPITENEDDDPTPTPPASGAALPIPEDDGRPLTNDDSFYTLIDEGQDDSVRQFTPDETICKKYVEGADIYPGMRTLLLKSAMGTGKTYAVIDYIKAGNLPRVLIVTHRRSLVKSIVDRFHTAGLTEFTSYADFLGMDLPVGALDRHVTTIDSLPQLAGAAPYDLVIIDETTQVYEHQYAKRGTMTSSTNEAAHNALNRILKNAGQVIGLDAGMTDTITDWLTRLRGNCVAIENTYRPDRGIMTMVNSPAVPIEQALTAVATASEPVVIVTNSRSDSELYYAVAKKVYPQKSVELVNAHTGDTKGELLSDINEWIKGVDILITSPSIGTGVDIQTPVAGVYGVFFGQPTIPGDNMQQIMRFRHASVRTVFHVASESDKLLTDPDAIKRDYHATAMKTAQAADFDSHALSFATDVQMEMLIEHANAQAARNCQRRDTMRAFRQIAIAEGFEIVIDNTTTADGMKTLLSKTRKEIGAKNDALRMTVELVSRDEYRRLAIAGELTPIIRLGNERWKIETLLGVPITEELNAEYKSATNRAAFRRFCDLRLTQDELTAKDRAEASKLIYRRRHHTQHVEVFNGVVELAFPDGGLLSDERVGRAELHRRCAAFVQTNTDAIRRLDGRSDLSTDPVKVVMRILKRFHIALAYTQRKIKDADERVIRDADGKALREMVYWIDQDRLAVIEVRAQVALKAQENRTKNTEVKHINLRVFSPQPRLWCQTPPEPPQIAASALKSPPMTPAEMAALQF